MSKITIQDLYNLNETIAAELFDGLTYPWEALPKIGDFIRKLGASLSEEEYEKIGEECKSISKCVHSRAGYYWKRGGSTSLCFHTRECTGRRGGSGRQFYRTEKCCAV